MTLMVMYLPSFLSRFREMVTDIRHIIDYAFPSSGLKNVGRPWNEARPTQFGNMLQKINILKTIPNRLIDYSSCTLGTSLLKNYYYQIRKANHLKYRLALE